MLRLSSGTGIVCNIRLIGVVITDSGRFLEMEKEKRTYTGTFDGCTAFCDSYNEDLCVGVAYDGGDCKAYDQITGSFVEDGTWFAIRQ